MWVTVVQMELGATAAHPSHPWDPWHGPIQAPALMDVSGHSRHHGTAWGYSLLLSQKMLKEQEPIWSSGFPSPWGFPFALDMEDNTDCPLVAPTATSHMWLGNGVG